MDSKNPKKTDHPEFSPISLKWYSRFYDDQTENSLEFIYNPENILISKDIIFKNKKIKNFTQISKSDLHKLINNCLISGPQPLYEYCISKYRKLVIDIDDKKLSKSFDNNIDLIINELISILSDFGLELTPMSFIVCKMNDANKNSCHIIYPDRIFSYVSIKKILTRLHSKYEDVDIAIACKTQQIRLYGCAKEGTNRIKLASPKYRQISTYDDVLFSVEAGDYPICDKSEIETDKLENIDSKIKQPRMINNDLIQKVLENDNIVQFLNDNHIQIYNSIKLSEGIYILTCEFINRDVNCIYCNRIHISNNYYMIYNIVKNYIEIKCHDITDYSNIKTIKIQDIVSDINFIDKTKNDIIQLSRENLRLSTKSMFNQTDILDVNCKKLEFDDKQLIDNRFVFIKSDVMTGKSTKIREFIQSNPTKRFLYITNRIQQSREFQTILSDMDIRVLNYKSIKQYKKRAKDKNKQFNLFDFMKDEEVKVFICGIQSIKKATLIPFDYCIVDECASIHDEIMHNSFRLKNKYDVITMLKSMRCFIHKWIMMDHCMSPIIIEWYRDLLFMNGQKQQFIYNEYSTLADRKIVSVKYTNRLTELIHESINKNDGLVTTIISPFNRKYVETLYSEFITQYPQKRIILITGNDNVVYNNQGNKEHIDYKREIIDKIAAKEFECDILLYTSTITCGVSIEMKNASRIYMLSQENMPILTLQSMFRVRNFTECYIHLSKNFKINGMIPIKKELSNEDMLTLSKLMHNEFNNVYTYINISSIGYDQNKENIKYDMSNESVNITQTDILNQSKLDYALDVLLNEKFIETSKKTYDIKEMIDIVATDRLENKKLMNKKEKYSDMVEELNDIKIKNLNKHFDKVISEKNALKEDENMDIKDQMLTTKDEHTIQWMANLNYIQRIIYNRFIFNAKRDGTSFTINPKNIDISFIDKLDLRDTQNRKLKIKADDTKNIINIIKKTIDRFATEYMKCEVKFSTTRVTIGHEIVNEKRITIKERLLTYKFF